MAEEKKTQKAFSKPVAAAKVEEKSAVKLVKLEYKKDNTHILHHVHAVSKGVSSVPLSAWLEAKKAPANQALLKAGHLVVLEGDEESAE